VENQVWNVPQVIPYRFSAFRSQKFRISADCKIAVCSHCTTDVQPMHSSVRGVPWFLPSVFFWYICQSTVVFITISINCKVCSAFQASFIPLVDVIGFNLYNPCDSCTDDRTKLIVFNWCNTGRNRSLMTAVLVE